MILNATQRAAVLKGLRAIAYNELRRGVDENWWRRLFSVIRSDNPKEVFHMLKGGPEMREWLGDRQLRHFSEVSFEIEKKDWEASITFLRDEVIFDKLGQVRPAVRTLSQAWGRHLQSMAIDLVLNGFTENAYDGQFFFDTDHDNYGGAVVSNKAITAFSKDAWATAKAAAASIKDPDTGRFLGIRYTDIVYGVNSAAVVKQVFNGEIEPTTHDPNIYYRDIPPERQHEVPELGNTGKWFLYDLSKPIKPYLLMIVQGPEFAAMDSAKDWNVFNRKEYIYGVDTIDNSGYGLWEVAYGSTNAE